MPEKRHPVHKSVRIFSDLEELSLFSADYFLRSSEKTLMKADRYTVALSGGSTPKRLYTILAMEPWRSRIRWDSVHFFLVDERFVDYAHPDSNYRMIKESLFDRVPLPASNIHPMPVQPDPQTAALSYELHLKEFFVLRNGEIPLLDLIFLGIGDDGHTASLFPHSEALKISDRLVVSNYVEKLASHRITLTEPVLNSAKEVLFLISGAAKKHAFKQVLEGAFHPEEFPAQLIRPAGELLYLADEDAAAELKQK